MNNHRQTVKMRRFLFGYVYKTVANYMGESDIEKIHRWCMGRFGCGMFSLKEMDYHALHTYIDNIIKYFTTEHGLVFGEEDFL